MNGVDLMIYIEKNDGEVPTEIAIQYTTSYSENNSCLFSATAFKIAS